MLDVKAAETRTGAPGRFALLDGLRALAGLGVFFAHGVLVYGADAQAPVQPLIHGIGLSSIGLFFALSGFLLYRPFVVARLAGHRRPRLGRYAQARLLRIVPAYWVALTLLALWPGLPGVFSEDWWAYYGFAQIYLPQDVQGGIGAAWTLNVEAVYYLLLPGLAMILGRLGGRSAVSEVGGLMLLALGSLVAQIALDERAELAASAMSLTGGMALATWHARMSHRGQMGSVAQLLTRRPGIGWSATTALVIMLAGLIWLTRGDDLLAPRVPLQTAAEYILITAAAVLALATGVVGAESAGAIPRVLASRPAAYMAKLSYGLYLYHLPIITHIVASGAFASFPVPFAAVVLVAFAASLACAAASWHLVERPLLGLKARGSRC